MTCQAILTMLLLKKQLRPTMQSVLPNDLGGQRFLIEPFDAPAVFASYLRYI
jgi:hypothetical protein